MKRPVLKRVIAYIVDFIIVLFIASLFSNIDVVNPYVDEYNDMAEKYITSLGIDTLEETEDINDIINVTTMLENETLLEEMTYKTSYYGVYVNIIAIVISLLYFVVFQYFNNGKTIGKAIFGIKVVTEDMEKPNITSFLIRCLIINNILADTINVVLVRTTSQAVYMEYSNVVELIGYGLILASFLLMVFRSDARGLHDLLAGTVVINSNWKEDEQEEYNDSVKEAKVV